MDKSRQQFEAYFLKKPQNHIDPLKKDQFGYYYYLVTREAWEAWQASRESLEVELPDCIEYDQEYRECDYEEGYRKGYNTSLLKCENILINNGVKIKMNKNELQVLIDYTKGMIADNKEPEKKVIIALCDELNRIINQYPTGFAHEKELRNIDVKFTTLHPLKTSYHNIPLYRLD